MTYDIVLLIHVYPDPINVRHVNELDLGINNGRIEFGFILFKKNQKKKAGRKRVLNFWINQTGVRSS